jgi:hypothetical protein
MPLRAVQESSERVHPYNLRRVRMGPRASAMVRLRPGRFT